MMFTLLGSVCLGTVAGVASALVSVKVATRTLTLRHGNWRTFAEAGTRAPGWKLNLQSAAVAVVGLFALRKEEAVYFTADHDQLGRPLDSSYDYELCGRALPARWWSFTVYGPDNRLIANEWDRYSLHHGNITLSPDGSYRVLLARRPQGGDWIPTGKRKFNVFLRVFGPASELIDPLTELSLPVIRRLETT
jgi:hypothetical protein